MPVAAEGRSMPADELTCEECGKAFESEKALTAHVEAEHLDELSSMK
jgi:uncharacterized C2H2 Zn-finger protein